MTIKRINPAKRWSDAVIYNDTIYYTSVPDNLDADVTAQTANVLADIDIMLSQLGSSKERILDVTIFLADRVDFASMNAAWDAWVPEGNAPVRCTVEAALMKPQYKVEIKIVAAC
ncbi:RidA family protein [Budviciaceae bacterium BWR-B9]|uniref:RidA family protein n=1 Tax=Limnobaculum allomyrinae TaxID=2791986 RepID=A0ABS1IL72_9GAMM|nr:MULTISPECIES: RidA family protein [Limnobaculum]MBK5142483.1 RidA family protein [Limnobaculum allomyrinae]MBV7690632.1 RidA family protein [Limnobaculum sp. M2-1]